MRGAAAVGVILITTFGPQAQPQPQPRPAPQMPARDTPQPPKTGTGRLSGTVTALDTGRPIRRAVVRLSSPELREGKSVSTDAEGHWELRELPSGKFSLQVTKGGYVSLSYGQRRPFEAGKMIDLANGQVLEKLDVALPRGSAVGGRVVDEFGEPVVGAGVAAVRYRYVSGRRRIVATGTGDTTDDRGEFRLHSLPPGDYYVTAQARTFTFLSTSEDKTGYGQTFYPGTLNANEAQRLTLAVGQEAQNIVIPLARSRMATLRGTATTSEGKPVPMGVVMLAGAGAESSMSVSPGMVRDGVWTMSGVAPGDYQLALRYMPNLEQLAYSGSGGIGNMTAEFAVLDITVTGEDMSDINLVTSAGGTIKGTLVFEGGKPPAAAPPGTSLVAFDPRDVTPLSTTAGMVRADWSFEIRNVVGRRVIRTGEIPSGWTLKSITVDGQDITDTGIAVANGQDISGIEVLLTQSAAEVSGTVENAKGTPVTDYVVLLFSPDADKWGFRSRFINTARPDQTGRFQIRGVTPATYLAVALEYVEPGEETNPEFLERIRSLGTRISIAEGEKKTLALTLAAQ